MKFVQLHTKNTAIVYKNAICSLASLIVIVFVVFSVMIPIILVSLLSPYSGISESRVLFEQPRVQFKFRHIFVGETTEMSDNGDGVDPEKIGMVVCSSFPNFNQRMEDHTISCEGTEYWTEDLDNNGNADKVHFCLQLDSVAGRRFRNFDLALFFKAHLKHKCSLSPPTLLTHHLDIPEYTKLGSGTILLKAELELKQYVEFICPFPGRNTKTRFRDVILNTNTSSSNINMNQFQIPSLLELVKSNPAFFQLNIRETYFRRDFSDGLRIQLDIDVLQVSARYHLSVWERLGQFWLYFASFFGISFYIMNKLKDYLFGHHIIRSWEVIPWKKLY